MASGMINDMNVAKYLYLGSISATSQADAIAKAYQAISIYDQTVVGHFDYSGKWSFIGYKYSDVDYGMILVIHYKSPWVAYYKHQNGDAELRYITTTVSS